MTILEAIILGIVQGATEFLPVSSSGHSVLVPELLNLNSPSLQAVAIAHLGTLLAVIIYFFKQLWEITVAVVQGLIARKPLADPNSRLGWWLVVGSIPAAVIGLTFEETFESIFADPRYAAAFLLVTAFLLVLGEKLRSGAIMLDELTWRDALIIGLFQVLALFPGVSRSGSTIVGGLIRGLNRETAARYSFLMSVPVILGAGLQSVFDLLGDATLAAQLPALVTVFTVSAIVGYACIAFLLRWVRQRNLYPFALYCALFGVLYLAGSFLVG